MILTVVPWDCCGILRALLRSCFGIAAALPWYSCGNAGGIAVGSRWDCCGVALVLLLYFCVVAVGLL